MFFCAGNRSLPNRFIGVLKSSRWFACILLTCHISSILLINSFVILVSPPFYLPPFAFISLSPSFFLLLPPFNFFSWEGGPWILPIHLLHCKHLLALKKNYAEEREYIYWSLNEKREVVIKHGLLLRDGGCEMCVFCITDDDQVFLGPCSRIRQQELNDFWLIVTVDAHEAKVYFCQRLVPLMNE